MKNKIIEIVSENNKINKRRVTESYFKNNHVELYWVICEKYKVYDITFNEILYLIINGLHEPPKCVVCGNAVRFKKFSQGYSKYCSMICIGKDKNIQIKRENTSINNFGVKYTLLSDEKRNDIKKQNLLKYGVEYPQQLDYIKEKTKTTNIKKYGVEHHLQLESQQKKQKDTLMKNHGVENPMKSSEIKRRAKETLIKKFGVDSYSKTDEFKILMKENSLLKYGVESPFSDQGVKDKILNTNIEKYGFPSYSMTSEFIDKVKTTKLKKFGDENYNNRDKAKKSSMIKYGYDNPSKSKEVIDKIQKTVNDLYKVKYSKLLLINPDDIIINGTSVTIRKYCKTHNDFEISKSLLYSRLIFNRHENICTKCNPIAENSSILENELKLFIRSLDIEYVENCTFLLNKNQEIDIYLPNNKLCIEFNGVYWHSDLFKNNNYHLNKTIECENLGLQLIHIFDDEWIHKKEIVKSIIKSKLGIIETKIFARKCIIREIENKVCDTFLDYNHIQGSINSKIKLGLFYENELVSVMTFDIARKGLGNINKNEKHYNLSRFCTKLNTQVIGGAGKLLKHFIKKYSPENIITYADRRYSVGGLYENLGFTKIRVNKPSYFFFSANKKIRYHRFAYRKEILIKLDWFDENKTIDEILIEHKLYKIYDCGTIKYEMKII